MVVVPQRLLLVKFLPEPRFVDRVRSISIWKLAVFVPSYFEVDYFCRLFGFYCRNGSNTQHKTRTMTLLRLRQAPEKLFPIISFYQQGFPYQGIYHCNTILPPDSNCHHNIKALQARAHKLTKLWLNIVIGIRKSTFVFVEKYHYCHTYLYMEYWNCSWSIEMKIQCNSSLRTWEMDYYMI